MKRAKTLSSIPRKFREPVAEIMENFDFANVFEVMRATDWRWQNRPVTLDQIKQHAHDLLTEVVSSRVVKVSCGGFTASRCGEVVELLFVVNSWEWLLAATIKAKGELR